MDQIGAEAEEAEPWTPVLRRLEAAYAPATIRQCRSSFRPFWAWCGRAGLRPLPAEPETVAEFLDTLFETQARSTVLTRLWCLRLAHRVLELPDPGLAHPVRLALRRGARRVDPPGRPAISRQASPVNAAVRDRLLAACSDTPMGLRDRALLRLGYDTLCRQGELVRLRVEDMEPLPEGGARILVPRAKTDPFARGEYVYVTEASLPAVRAWLARAGVERGPILRHAFRRSVGQAALEPHAVRRRLRALARAAGFPEAMVRAIGGHSMRVGAAHDLAVNGASLAQIMRAGRWRSMESAAHYMREAPVNIWAAMAARASAAPTDEADDEDDPAG